MTPWPRVGAASTPPARGGGVGHAHSHHRDEHRARAFDPIIAVNLRGLLLCMQAEIALMRGGAGAIVTIASTAGVSGWPGLSAYAASKHGVIGLTRCTTLECATEGIRINAVSPGHRKRPHDRPLGRSAEIARAVPLGRLGRPTEVADAVVWLCSPQASFVTGANLVVDGGRMAGGAQ